MNNNAPFTIDDNQKMVEGYLVEPSLTQPFNVLSRLVKSTSTTGIDDENT